MAPKSRNYISHFQVRRLNPLGNTQVVIQPLRGTDVPPQARGMDLTFSSAAGVKRRAKKETLKWTVRRPESFNSP